MSDMTLDPRMVDWLADGPARAPVESFGEIMARVDATPRSRPILHLGRRPVFRGQLAAIAATFIVVVGAGVMLREPISDVLAPARSADDLLARRPETRTILQTSGGPADSAQRTVVGILPDDRALVVAAACTGQGEIRVQVVPDVESAPGEPPPSPYRRVAVACDGTVGELFYATLGGVNTGDLQLVVDADAGTTWRLSMGELRDRPAEPTFPAIDPGEGRLLLADGIPMLSSGLSDETGGIGFDPAGAESVVALVQCLGDPVTVWASTGAPGENEITGSPLVRVTCDDASRTTEVPIPGSAFGNVRAVSEGFTWTRLAAASTNASMPARPEAPPMPDGLADSWFAEGDGETVAFGRLGGNRQQLVRLDGATVGSPGGEHVAVAVPDGAGGTSLELWSIPDGARVARLATIDGAQVFDSWVDATHRQVFYGRSGALGAGEYRRVGFDGSGDVEIAATPPGGVLEAQAGLALDDSTFIAQWCPRVGSCERVVYDAATGTVTKVDRGQQRMCALSGIIGETVVGLAPECDVATSVVTQRLGGGAPTTISGGGDARIVLTSQGPQVALLVQGETRSTLSLVGLDGTGRRDVATVEHASGSNPSLFDLRLPTPGWVLLATSLADTPTNHVVRSRPLLVNVETGERIELPNLPSDD